MDHHKLVLPEHMNHHGSLFGGYLLKWIDEFAYITANIEFPGNRFVTIALDNVIFKHHIACGQILCFAVKKTRLGTTSLDYSVEVYGERGAGAEKGIMFETKITFVAVSKDGTKKPLVA